MAWVGILALAFLGPMLTGALLMASPAGAGQQRAGNCDITPYLDKLNASEAPGDKSKIVLSYPDYGPNILYRTPHSVLSIPNHRPQPGYRAMGEIFTADSTQKARSLIDLWNVDLVLICPPSRHIEMLQPGDQKRVFYDFLAEGPRPDWIREIPTEEPSETAMKLFQVVR